MSEKVNFGSIQIFIHQFVTTEICQHGNFINCNFINTRFNSNIRLAIKLFIYLFRFNKTIKISLIHVRVHSYFAENLHRMKCTHTLAQTI